MTRPKVPWRRVRGNPTEESVKCLFNGATHAVAHGVQGLDHRGRVPRSFSGAVASPEEQQSGGRTQDGAQSHDQQGQGHHAFVLWF